MISSELMSAFGSFSVLVLAIVVLLLFVIIVVGAIVVVVVVIVMRTTKKNVTVDTEDAIAVEIPKVTVQATDVVTVERDSLMRVESSAPTESV